MIVSTLIAASVAAQPTPASQPTASPAPTVEKKMACCEKTAKDEGCCCCKGMAKDSGGEHGMSHGNSAGTPGH
jgi:hypothetical protein